MGIHDLFPLRLAVKLCEEILKGDRSGVQARINAEGAAICKRERGQCTGAASRNIRWTFD